MIILPTEHVRKAVVLKLWKKNQISEWKKQITVYERSIHTVIVYN